MHPDEHLASVEEQLDLFVAALDGTPLDRPVPSCPDWTVRDLAEHVDGFNGFWTHVLCEGTGAEKPDFPPLEGDDAVTWFRASADRLLDALRATPLDAEVWTWVPDEQNVAFIRRRATQELAIHRIDAQLAAGSPTPIDAAVAEDNVAEIVLMIPHAPNGPPEGDGERTLGLHPTDLDEDLVLTLQGGGPALERTRAGGADLVLSGTMSDLALLLNGRPTQGEVARAGDEAVYDEWREVFRFG
jgi:uncharacterized protein (TIGR03083 family)